MDPARNPYTPGAGRTPPALVGRAAELASGDLLIQRTANGLAGRSMMLYGLRGVGKTVLLNELRRRADAAGWLTAMIEATQDKKGADQSRARLARELTAGARSVQSWRTRASEKAATALATIQSFSVKAGVGPFSATATISPSDRAASGDIELDLEELVADVAPALREARIAMALFIDEIQDLDVSTLSALLAAQHRAAQNEWPFYVFGAGLPVVPATLADARSYAERQFDYRNIDRLTADDARAALADPATTAGASYEPEALDLLLGSARGYPYFLQVYGDQAWQCSPQSPIRAEDAQVAITLGTDELDRSLFASRWERATPKQKQLMAAMAVDHGPSSVADLVARMRKNKPSDLSVFRDELIKKGLIYAPERGYLDFTVPLMADFLRRHNTDL